MSAILKLFNTFIIRDLKKNWVRTTLTMLGIAIGVCVVLAINLANRSSLSKFQEAVDAVAGKANLEIIPQSSPCFDQSILKDIAWISQIGGKYTPVIKESVLFANGAQEFVQLLGVDMLADPDFTNYHELPSQPNDDLSNKDEIPSEAVDFLNENPAGTVLVGDRLATRHGLKPGSKFDLIINDQIHHFTVTGLLSNQGLGGAYSGDLVIIDLDTAQTVLGIPGKINQVEIIVADKDLNSVRDKLLSQLPQGLAMENPGQHGQQVEKMTAAFQFNLSFLSFIALMVGMLLIYNTMTICVIRRRAELGTLRTLGLSRGAIMILFVMEALTIGLVGSAVGVIGGVWLAQFALSVVAGTIQYFYVQMPLSSVEIDWTLVGLIFLGGTGLTVLASVPSVIEASCTAPAEATRRASHDVKIHRYAGKLALTGISIFLMGSGVTIYSSLFNSPILGHVAVVLVMVACLLMGPFVLKKTLMPLSNVVVYWLGSEGKIAVRSLYGALGKTSVAVASLTVGIAMMIALSVAIKSFRATVGDWIDQTFVADLCVEPTIRIRGSKTARMPADIVSKITDIPAVAAVDTFTDVPMQYQGNPIFLAGANFGVTAKYGHLNFISGESTIAVCSRMQNNDAVVSEGFALKNKVKQGDVIALLVAGHNLRLKIQGIYYNYMSDIGYVVVPQSLFSKIFHNSSVSSCSIYLKPGSNASKVRSEIVGRIGAKSPVIVSTINELRNESIKIFDRTFAVVYALDLIVVVVAMLVIMNSLYALTLESRRDFGILRYLGASQNQLKKIVLTQAGILGVAGNFSGLGLGLVLAYLVVNVVNRQSFGWTVRLSFPIDFLVESMLVVAIVSILSGLAPAMLAARTMAPEVVHDE